MVANITDTLGNTVASDFLLHTFTVYYFGKNTQPYFANQPTAFVSLTQEVEPVAWIFDLPEVKDD